MIVSSVGPFKDASVQTARACSERRTDHHREARGSSRGSAPSPLAETAACGRGHHATQRIPRKTPPGRPVHSRVARRGTAMTPERFVVDNSIVMGWCFEDESSALVDAVLASLEDGQALVPAIWPLEVGNVLLVAERKRHIGKADVVRFLELVGSLPILVEQESPERMLTDILALARELRLSTYDASYLDLAMRSDLPLATQDRALIKRMFPLYTCFFSLRNPFVFIGLSVLKGVCVSCLHGRCVGPETGGVRSPAPRAAPRSFRAVSAVDGVCGRR